MKKVNVNKLRTAIVHDYLRTFGGGERVLISLKKAFPQASIHIDSVNYQGMGRFYKTFEQIGFEISWIQKISLAANYPLLYRPLLPLIWSSFDLKNYDIIISSSGSNISKGVKKPSKCLHLCYCHTPPRFLYDLETETNGFMSTLLKIILKRYLKYYDLGTNLGVDYFIANSKTVRRRIKKYYKRNSVVIYPPVVLNNSNNKNAEGKYYLVVSRLVKYKNIDLIIKTANKYSLALKIVGTGKEMANLKKIAGKTVDFMGELSDSSLRKIISECKCLIVATSNEDFGITAIEAMSFGKPVLSFYSGGHKETVIDGKNGYFFKKLTISSLKKAINKLDQEKIDPENCVEWSKAFSEERFVSEMKNFVTNAYIKKISSKM